MNPTRGVRPPAHVVRPLVPMVPLLVPSLFTGKESRCPAHLCLALVPHETAPLPGLSGDGRYTHSARAGAARDGRRGRLCALGRPHLVTWPRPPQGIVQGGADSMVDCLSKYPDEIINNNNDNNCYYYYY